MGVRKIFKKKKTARDKAPKGATIYKVKGGWSISRTRKHR